MSPIADQWTMSARRFRASLAATLAELPGHRPERADLLSDRMVRELSAHLHPEVQVSGDLGPGWLVLGNASSAIRARRSGQ